MTVGVKNDTAERDMENSRWRIFSRDWIATEKGDSLDISWICDSDNISAEDLPEPHVLAGEAMTELTEALRQLDELMQALGQGDEANTQKFHYLSNRYDSTIETDVRYSHTIEIAISPDSLRVSGFPL